MLRILGCFLLCLGWVGSASAQLGAYNPYAKEPEIINPIAPDGKLIWPTFYKSAATKAKFDELFACGICRGTSAPINAQINGNKLNVNELSEGNVLGYCVSVAAGMCSVKDVTGKTTTLVTHPMHVTKLSVAGPMTSQGLSVGLTVRFQAKVNEKNLGVDPIDALDVFTPTKETKIPPVMLNRLQTIVGTIYRWEEKRHRLTIATDKAHRYIFTVTDHATVNVDASTMNLIFPGDEVSAKGQLYLGETLGASPMIFASHIEAKKNPSPIPNIVEKPAEAQP